MNGEEIRKEFDELVRDYELLFLSNGSRFF